MQWCYWWWHHVMPVLMQPVPCDTSTGTNGVPWPKRCVTCSFHLLNLTNTIVSLMLLLASWLLLLVPVVLHALCFNHLYSTNAIISLIMQSAWHDAGGDDITWLKSHIKLCVTCLYLTHKMLALMMALISHDAGTSKSDITWLKK